jgi:hypothetical protein
VAPSALAQRTRDLFAELGWPVVGFDGTDTIGTAWNDGRKEWRALAAIDETGCEFVFYTQAPFAVPADRRDAAARLVARANWGLPTAAIELDLDTGDARVRCGFDLGGEEPTLELLRRTVFANLAVASVYLPALEEVVGGDDPDAVVARVEDGIG